MIMARKRKTYFIKVGKRQMRSLIFEWREIIWYLLLIYLRGLCILYIVKCWWIIESQWTITIYVYLNMLMFRSLKFKYIYIIFYLQISMNIMICGDSHPIIPGFYNTSTKSNVCFYWNEPHYLMWLIFIIT